jgi:hypothetical protein
VVIFGERSSQIELELITGAFTTELTAGAFTTGAFITELIVGPFIARLTPRRIVIPRRTIIQPPLRRLIQAAIQRTSQPVTQAVIRRMIQSVGWPVRASLR